MNLLVILILLVSASMVLVAVAAVPVVALYAVGHIAHEVIRLFAAQFRDRLSRPQLSPLQLTDPPLVFSAD